MMTLEGFKASLLRSDPPEDIPALLQAIWYDGKEQWDKAHEIAQDISTADGAWVHAYLHRKEGDEGNAAYWYRRAGKVMPGIPIEQEWDQIAKALLGE